MIDVKTKLRTAYFQALNGNLSYTGGPVAFTDGITTTNADPRSPYAYVTSQYSRDERTLDAFISKEYLVITIVAKGITNVNTEILDSIAGQIFAIVIPGPPDNGLPAQSGISINNVFPFDDRYISLTLNAASSEARRIITFVQDVAQT